MSALPSGAQIKHSVKEVAPRRGGPDGARHHDLRAREAQAFLLRLLSPSYDN
jgi:hypothetical protein